MKIIKQRTTISIIIILLLFILLLLRLFYIQIFNNELYIDRAYDLWTRNIVVNSRRGNIYDRNGELIVGNKLAPTISIIPSQIKDKDFAASLIAGALGYEVSDIIYHFNKNVSVEIIKPEALKLTEEQAKEIMKHNIDGVYLSSDVIRYYPYGSYLSHVIGIVGVVRDFGTTFIIKKIKKI